MNIRKWLNQPVLKELRKIMATLDDILAKQELALSKATANTDALSAIKTVLDANTATIADLKAQLDAAGQDPTKLQELSDNMDKLLAAQDTQAAAEAILAGTSPAPAPEPAPADAPADAGAADASGSGE